MNNELFNYSNIYDSLHSTPKYLSEGYPMLRAADIKDNFITDEILKSCVKVSYSYYIKHNKNYKPKKGDIIITRVVVNLGKVAYINTDTDFCLGQNIAIISAHDHKEFIYYYLKSSIVKEWIYNMVSGSAYKLIGLADIKKIPISIVDNCDNIGKFLYEIENQIMVNNLIISKINTYFDLTYNYLFNYFCLPFKGFNNNSLNMIYDDTLEKNIPSTWSLKKITDICEFKKGTEPGADNYSSDYKDRIPFYRVSDMNNGSCVYIDKEFAKEEKCNYGDLLVSFDGTIGKIAIDLKGIFSTGMKKVVPKNSKYYGLIYIYFNSFEIQDIMHRYSNGSILKHASDSIEHLYIPYNKDAFEKYCELINPLYDKIVRLKKETNLYHSILKKYSPLLINEKILLEKKDGGIN